MVLTHGGLAFPSGKKQTHVADPFEGHAPRVDRAQSRMGGGLSIQVTWQRAARKTGSGLPGDLHRGFRPWLLLARASLPKRTGAWEQQVVLEREVPQEQGPRRPERSEVAECGMVSLDHLGMFLVHDTKTRGDPASARVGVEPQEGGAPLKRQEVLSDGPLASRGIAKSAPNPTATRLGQASIVNSKA